MTPTANKTKKTKHTRKEKGRSGVTIILKHYMIRHILFDKDEERCWPGCWHTTLYY